MTQLSDGRSSWMKSLGSKDTNVSFSEHGDERLKDAGVSVKKTKDGKYYVCTHRARGKYRDSVAKIPDSEITEIRATGSKTAGWKPFVPPRGMKIVQGGDAVPGGYNGWGAIYEAASGEKMGYLDYQSAHEGPPGDRTTYVTIAMVEVDPKYRRQGVATALMEWLRNQFPEGDEFTGKVEYDPGYTTADGSAWWSRVAGAIPALPEYAVEQQFSQYPSSGPEGVSYFKGEINEHMWVDCLLYFMGGKLVAVLNRFPKDMGPEKKNNVLLIVREEYRRQGIGTALWREAQRRWDVRAQGQDQTPNGKAFTDRVGALTAVLAGAKGDLPEDLTFTVRSDSIMAGDGDMWIGTLNFETDHGEDIETGLPQIYVASIEVRPDYRRRGVGAAMYAKLLETYPPHRYTIAHSPRTSDGASFAKAIGLEDTGVQMKWIGSKTSASNQEEVLDGPVWDFWTRAIKGNEILHFYFPGDLSRKDALNRAKNAYAGSQGRLVPTGSPMKGERLPSDPRKEGKTAAKAVTHAGIAIQAEDTGRVLMLQRSFDPTDDPDVQGTWEFPGGSIDEGESPEEAAWREFHEETGLPRPECTFEGSWTSNGVYQGHLFRVKKERKAFIEINPDIDACYVENPDDRTKDNPDVTAWMSVQHIKDLGKALRPAVRTGTDWDLFKISGIRTTSAMASSGGVFRGRISETFPPSEPGPYWHRDTWAEVLEMVDSIGASQRILGRMGFTVEVEKRGEPGKVVIQSGIRPGTKSTERTVTKIGRISLDDVQDSPGRSAAIGPWVRMEEGRPAMEIIPMDNDVYTWRCPKCGDEGRPTWDEGNNLESAQSHAEACQQAAHFREVDLITPTREYDHKVEWAKRHPHLVDQLGRAYVAGKQGVFWRVHPQGRAFGDWDAHSKPFYNHDGEEPEPGYSCFENPWHLYLYVGLMWSRLYDGTTVLRFPGERVGEGHDGEDLAMPSALPFKTTWGSLQEMLPDLPVPDSPIFAPWVRQRREMASWSTLAKHWAWLDMEDPVHEFIIEKFGGRK